MAKHQHIEPFPGSIDRDHFGSWLSGFTDGEGCFSLGWVKKNAQSSAPGGRFTINLRADDRDALMMIQSYWQAGFVIPVNNRKGRSNPQVRLNVLRTGDLASIVVPHFERFPLFAKKRRDFDIWKQGIQILRTVAKRRIRGCGYSRGTQPRWSAAEKAEFDVLRLALIRQRKYQDSPPEPRDETKTIEESPPSDQGRFFWD